MKQSYLIATVVVCMLMAACSKDKYTTTPKLEFKSVNGSSFVTGATITFKFNVTDKEGDLQDSMWIQKFSLICPDANTETPVPFFIAFYYNYKNFKTELDINYTYGSNNPGGYVPIDRALCAQQRNDSLYFRFWIRDKAGHVSDTITSPTITLLKD